MALAIVGTVVTNGVGSGFGTIGRPSGTAAGNILLVFVACDGSATGGSIGVPAASSGGSDWTTLFTAQHPTLDGQWLHGFKHVIESGDAPGGYSFSSSNIANGNDYSQVVVEISGQDTTTPIDATAVVVTDSSANASPVSVNISSGITTATNGAFVFYIGAGDPAASNSNSWSGPSGYTSDGSVGANYAPLQVSHKEQTTAGATGAVSATLTLASGNAGFAGALVAVRPASGGGTSVTLTGNSVTSSVGNVTSGVGETLSGATVTLSQGNVSVPVDRTLTGNSVAVSQGTVVLGTVVTLTGQAISSALGATSSALTETLTGQAVTVSTGNVSVTYTTAPSTGYIPMPGPGLRSPFNLNQFKPDIKGILQSNDVSRTLSGITVALSQGAVAEAIAYSLSGNLVTFAQGTATVSGANSVTLTGQSITSSTGTVVSAVLETLSGASVTVSTGTVAQAIAVTLAGSQVSISQGTVTPSGGVTAATITIKAGSWIRYRII